MGGKLLNGRRIDSKEFLSTFNYCKQELINHGVLDKLIKYPYYLKHKESFGDIDIVICTNHKISTIFPNNEFTKNHNVYSTLINGIQVDFVLVHETKFQTTLNYMSWGDLGNLIGKIYYRLGLSFGVKGLTKKYYSQDRSRLLDEITLSTDIKFILELIGLNYETWLNGFNDIKEIANFLRTSPYFGKNIYDLSTLDNNRRKRDSKRSMYQEFLSEIENDRSITITRLSEHDLCETFYGYKEKIDLIQQKEQRRKQLNQKFNGTIVMNLTGLTGEELGKFIHNFIITHDYSNLNEEEIKNLIQIHYNQWKTHSK